MTTLRRIIVRLAVAGLLLIGATACEPSGPVRYLDAPIASYRVNGIGWSTIIVGNTVYVGGAFTTVTDQQGATVASRANLAAFDKTTGALLTAFRADTNGTVRALASDGTNLYVGGDFTTLGGIGRGRLAAVDPVTGALRTAWRADAASRISSLSVGGNRLYAAGTFGAVGGVTRNRVAAVDLATGAVDPLFDPDVDNTVSTIAALPDRSRVFIGGSYTSVGGVASWGLTALRGDTGAVTTPTFRDVSGQALDLMLQPGGAHLAASLGDYGNQGAWFDTTTGAKVFRQRCDGDGQAVAVIGTTMLTGFHEACEGNASVRLVANSTDTGARDLTWLPSFDRFWGVRDLAVDGSTLVVAGDFTNVAGVPAQGFAVFRAAPPPPPPPVRLPRGSTWRYLDAGVLQAGWAGPAFDDGAWASGRAELGYGDGDESTVVSYGPSATNKYVTTWFRTTFQATAVPSTLTLDLVADDGAVVYLNGIEVARDNVGAGTDSATLRAASNRSGAAETAVRSLTLPPELVQVGANTLAVSVHQDVPGSSDLSLDAALRSTP